MQRVLLVDDDVDLTLLLREYLEGESFQVDTVHDGEEGVRMALEGDYAILVLDVMLPRLNGVDALRRIRRSSQVPVLMLTARGDDLDRVLGLELGADDYVPKPCTPRELVARLRAILRRVAPPAAAGSRPAELVAGPLTLWPERRRAHWAGRPLELTSTEFNLLTMLARDAGRVVSREALSEQGLGRPLTRYDRSIDVHLSSIRHKLGTLPDGRPWIQSVRGLGYQLVKA